MLVVSTKCIPTLAKQGLNRSWTIMAGLRSHRARRYLVAELDYRQTCTTVLHCNDALNLSSAAVVFVIGDHCGAAGHTIGHIKERGDVDDVPDVAVAKTHIA